MKLPWLTALLFAFIAQGWAEDVVPGKLSIYRAVRRVTVKTAKATESWLRSSRCHLLI